MPADPVGPAAPDDPDETGAGGDPANRTRLAWTRTAIAFAAIGAAMLRSSPAGGAIVLALSIPIWGAVRSTRRLAAGAPATRGLRLVTAIVVLVAVVALIVALAGHAPDTLAELLRGR
jgi:hypothetical protein